MEKKQKKGSQEFRSTLLSLEYECRGCGWRGSLPLSEQGATKRGRGHTGCDRALTATVMSTLTDLATALTECERDFAFGLISARAEWLWGASEHTDPILRAKTLRKLVDELVPPLKGKRGLRNHPNFKGVSAKIEHLTGISGNLVRESIYLLEPESKLSLEALRKHINSPDTEGALELAPICACVIGSTEKIQKLGIEAALKAKMDGMKADDQASAATNAMFPPLRPHERMLMFAPAKERGGNRR